jgi:hypothetical protein
MPALHRRVCPSSWSRLPLSHLCACACVLTWWMERTTVLPRAAHRARMPTTLDAILESRPVVGSSRKISRGSFTISRPRDTRLRSPVLPHRHAHGPTSGRELGPAKLVLALPLQHIGLRYGCWDADLH